MRWCWPTWFYSGPVVVHHGTDVFKEKVSHWLSSILVWMNIHSLSMRIISTGCAPSKCFVHQAIQTSSVICRQCWPINPIKHVLTLPWCWKLANVSCLTMKDIYSGGWVMTFMFLWCQAVDTRLQVKLADVQEQNEELEFRILELEEANAKVGGGGGWRVWGWGIGRSCRLADLSNITFLLRNV